MDDQINVLVTLPFPEKLLSPLREISTRINIDLSRAKDPGDIANSVWEKVEVLYTNYVLPDPQLAVKMKWIQFHWAGINHVIDAPILKKPGIVATTLSGAGATKMAEYIVMMILAQGLHLKDLLANQEKRDWPKDRWQRFNPLEMRASTVGIVGYGSIGRQVARLLHPFGARVLACKRDAMHPQDAGYTTDGFGDPEGAYVHRLYPSQAIRSMLRECDFVVVTLPLTSDTRNLIDIEELSACKPSAYLIDVSRGGVVNQDALIAALTEHKVAGAALDVFPEEPLPKEHPLWNMPNVILTPHVSGVSSHYDQRAVELFRENLKRYVEGSPLLNVIDLQYGY